MQKRCTVQKTSDIDVETQKEIKVDLRKIEDKQWQHPELMTGKLV